MEGQSNGKKWRTYKKTLSWFLIRALVQLLIHVWLFVTPKTAAHQASLSFTISYRLLKLMFIESVMPSNHLILCHPIPLLPSIFPSIRVFSNESVFCIRWPKYWSFSISPSNEDSGLISFRIDWFDLLASTSNRIQTQVCLEAMRRACWVCPEDWGRAPGDSNVHTRHWGQIRFLQVDKGEGNSRQIPDVQPHSWATARPELKV